METVKTSEALESQILEDARAKAKRIRDAAEKECAAIHAEGERRDAEESRRLDAGREAPTGRACAPTSKLPCPWTSCGPAWSFSRRRSTVPSRSCSRSFSAGELDGVIGRQVARAAFAFINQRLVVQSAGISAEEARRIVTANVPGAEIHSVTALPAEEAAEAGKGLIVETEDGSRRFRATLGS